MRTSLWSTLRWVGVFAFLVYTVVLLVRAWSPLDGSSLSHVGSIETDDFLAKSSDVLFRTFQKDIVICHPTINVEMASVVLNVNNHRQIHSIWMAQNSSLRGKHPICTGMSSRIPTFVEIWISEIITNWPIAWKTISPRKGMLTWRITTISESGEHLQFHEFAVRRSNFKGLESIQVHKRPLDVLCVGRLLGHRLPLVICGYKNRNGSPCNYEGKHILCGTTRPESLTIRHFAWVLFFLGGLCGFVAIMLLGSESPWALLGMVLLLIFIVLTLAAFNLQFFGNVMGSGEPIFEAVFNLRRLAALRFIAR